MGQIPILVDEEVHRELALKKAERAADSFNEVVRELMFGKDRRTRERNFMEL